MPNSSTANVAPPAANHTTPHKRTSGQASTPESTPAAPRTQETLLDAMPLELGDQVWEVDVETTRRMLSPKKFRSDVDKKDSYPFLESFTCLVDDHKVQPAMKSMPIPGPPTRWDTAAERVNYEPTATFLNNCVDNCVNALKRLRKSNNDLRDHWWTSLKFFVYDKPTKDGVEGAAPLKPDLVGVASGEAGDLVCYWSPPDSGKSGILLPVEVKKSWTEIIKQAATYARAMVSAAPLRLFSVVIGVNHLKGTLRFLIYHRGGLTMSHQISLQEPQGRRDVQSIIFAILLWRNHEDAGFPSCTSGPVSMLPSGDKNESVKLKTNEVLFSSLSIRGRGTCVLWATPEHEEPPQSSSLRPIRQTRRVTRVALEADTTNSQATRQGTTSSQAGRQGTTSSQVARQGTRSSQRQGTKRGATKREPLHTVDKNSAVKGESAVNDEPVDVIEPWRHLSYKPCYTPPPNLIGAPRPITREQFPDGLVMKYSFPHSAKRGIEAHVYEWCSGQFGVPIHLCTFEACRSDGGAFSNSFLLPSATSFEEHRSQSAFSSTKSPPDRRALQVIVTAEKGTSLEHCESVAELFTCVLHAQLGQYCIACFVSHGAS
ncbi:hypothetical protein C8Q80DRAFT_1139655 [Daedaleopsis nitida]|nr:hypothetical protein C8Q80DRAFT_1139655 [Daedaleopsis nitida]